MFFSIYVLSGLSDWTCVISNYGFMNIWIVNYLFLVCQFIFDVSGFIILLFSFGLETAAAVTLLDKNKRILYKRVLCVDFSRSPFKPQLELNTW